MLLFLRCWFISWDGTLLLLDEGEGGLGEEAIECLVAGSSLSSEELLLLLLWPLLRWLEDDGEFFSLREALRKVVFVRVLRGAEDSRWISS